jgi:hypothetical protein
MIAQGKSGSGDPQRESGQTLTEVATIMAVILMVTVLFSYFIAHDLNVIFSKVAEAFR